METGFSQHNCWTCSNPDWKDFNIKWLDNLLIIRWSFLVEKQNRPARSPYLLENKLKSKTSDLFFSTLRKLFQLFSTVVQNRTNRRALIWYMTYEKKTKTHSKTKFFPLFRMVGKNILLIVRWLTIDFNEERIAWKLPES